MKEDILKEVRTKENEKLIKFMRKNEVADEVTLLIIAGIGRDIEYYDILMNRIKERNTPLTADILKEEITKVLDEIAEKYEKLAGEE